MIVVIMPYIVVLFSISEGHEWLSPAGIRVYTLYLPPQTHFFQHQSLIYKVHLKPYFVNCKTRNSSWYLASE